MLQLFREPSLPLHAQVFLGGTWVYMLITLKVSLPKRTAKVAKYLLAEEILKAISKIDYRHTETRYILPLPCVDGVWTSGPSRVEPV